MCRCTFTWLLIVGTCLPACSGWLRLPDGPPRQAPAYRQYQIWSQGTPVTLRALEVRGDSLTGLAISRDPNCDPECRVTLALGQVDSVRTATGGSAVSFGFGVVMGFLASITALILLIWGSQLLRS